MYYTYIIPCSITLCDIHPNLFTWPMAFCYVVVSQDPVIVDLGAVNAANKLALQRIQLYQEDAATAANVTKRPNQNKGKGDGSAEAGWFGASSPKKTAQWLVMCCNISATLLNLMDGVFFLSFFSRKGFWNIGQQTLPLIQPIILWQSCIWVCVYVYLMVHWHCLKNSRWYLEVQDT